MKVLNSEPEQKMKVSIVIRVKNEAEGLKILLNKLKEQTEKDFEVIVVDDHSTDKTGLVAQENGAKVISLGKERFSYGKALNIGFKAAKGEFIISIPGHGSPANKYWLEELIKPFADPDIAATYGSQKAYADANFLEKVERYWVGHFNFNKFYPYLVNTNSAIRANIWKLIPFNEVVSANEDHIWAIQVAKLGYKVVLVPQAKFWHSHTGGLGKTLKRFRNEAWTYFKIRLGKYDSF